MFELQREKYERKGLKLVILQVYLQPDLNVVQYPRKIRAVPGKENVMHLVHFLMIPTAQITTRSAIIISDCDYVRSYGVENNDCKHSLA